MLTSILLVFALILAVVIGPNVEQTMWGPALLALSAACFSALVSLWRSKSTPSHLGLTLLGLVTCIWITWRALTSPVAEWAQADLLLLASAVCSFICIKSISGDPLAEKILRYGIALLLLANVIVMGMQVADPAFRVIYGNGSTFKFAAGFYPQYNHCANFLIGASLLTLGSACFSPDRRWMRIALAIIGMLGLGAIGFTQSRGGMLGAAVGMSVFCTGVLLIGYRKKTKWFPLAAIAFPIIGLTIAIVLMFSWQNAQEIRSAPFGGSSTISAMMDNRSRLEILGLAASCISLHPLLGGGSRSFSWECLQVWNSKDVGVRGTTPEFAHNEWVQAITDYGLIGGGLIAVVLFSIVIGACLRLIFNHDRNDQQCLDAWRLGGVAALAGVCTQACFSFVFHMLPDVMLLGIFLAMASSHSKTLSGTPKRLQQSILTVVLGASVLLFLPAGIKGSMLSLTTITRIYGKQAQKQTPAQKIEALDQAIAIWPMASLYHRRASQHQKLAQPGNGETQIRYANLAVADYKAALRLNPMHGESLINLANTLSHLQETDEAGQIYERLIRFQGGLETVYHGHYYYALHWQKKGIRQMADSKVDAAIESLKQAVYHVDQVYDLLGHVFMSAKDRSLQISCHEMLGMLFEAKGQNEEAMVCYERAAAMHSQSGRRIYLRSAILIAKEANALWFNRQPEKALGLFIQAYQRAQQTYGQLPEGITESQRNAFYQKLKNAIKILQDAKIAPE